MTTTTPQAALLSDAAQALQGLVDAHSDSMTALGSAMRATGVTHINIPGEMGQTASRFAAQIENAKAVLAKLQATQAEPVQAGELPDERVAFEREMCAQHGLTPVYFRRNENGYQNTATESAWTGWQARAALAARKPLPGGFAQPEIIFNAEGVAVGTNADRGFEGPEVKP